MHKLLANGKEYRKLKLGRQDLKGKQERPRMIWRAGVERDMIDLDLTC